MPLTATDRIQASFALVAPRAAELVDSFYSRLFSGYPAVRPLFPSDMQSQKRHLAAALGLVAKHAGNLGALEKPLMEMGARHVRYGARPEHYPIVRDTLLVALAEVAGDSWSEQLLCDWAWAIDAVAAMMLRGATAAAAA